MCCFTDVLCVFSQGILCWRKLQPEDKNLCILCGQLRAKCGLLKGTCACVRRSTLLSLLPVEGPSAEFDTIWSGLDGVECVDKSPRRELCAAEDVSGRIK